MFHASRLRPFARIALVVLVLTLAAAAWPRPAAAARITSPKEQFGFAVGADYQLVNYKQLAAYWKKLDAESDRMTVVDIGKTAEGRTMIMAVITSPSNQARLARYKDIARKLALAQGLTDAAARRLAAEGKAVVWIDGGLHATEILGSQQLVELVYRMVSANDAETRRILDDVILLAVPVNPDGLDLVADWYMREKDPQKRSMAGVPVLYQKYIGHDNNRDFYMNSQPETKAVSRELYVEWHPQIVYNQHQTGPAGTVLFAPPFRDPFNYVFDPLVPMGIDLVSAAMHNRFVTEGKAGATMRSGSAYSTWWNGGLRSTAYFHNIIGILTEAIGSPTPVDIPFLPERLLPKQDYPDPVAPQKWHFRQSIEYMITADLAILDVAAKNREDFLYRRYLMGKHAVEAGSKDSWTIVPDTVARVQAAIEKDQTRLTQEVEALQRRVGDFVVPGLEAPDLAFTIGTLAHDAGLESFGMRPVNRMGGEAPRRWDHMDERHADLSFAGDFPRFAAFLNTLERHRPIVLVETFTISRPVDKGAQPQASLELAVLVEKPAGPAGESR